MDKFEKLYSKTLTLFENECSSALGGSEHTGDYEIDYAGGDARIPTAIGQKNVKGKKGKKRKKLPVIQRRPMNYA